MWPAHVRSFLARHPWWRRTLVVLLVAAMAGSHVAQQRQVDRQRAAWGHAQRVWVATADASAGDPVQLAAREVPDAVVPVAAVAHLPDHPVASRRIGRGAIVSTFDLAGADPASSALVAGWRAVAIAGADVPAGVVAGEHVAVYADGSVLADDAVVLDVGVLDAGVLDIGHGAGHPAVTIAVPAARVAAVAAAHDRAVLAWRAAPASAGSG